MTTPTGRRPTWRAGPPSRPPGCPRCAPRSRGGPVGCGRRAAPARPRARPRGGRGGPLGLRPGHLQRYGRPRPAARRGPLRHPPGGGGAPSAGSAPTDRARTAAPTDGHPGQGGTAAAGERRVRPGARARRPGRLRTAAEPRRDHADDHARRPRRTTRTTSTCRCRCRSRSRCRRWCRASRAACSADRAVRREPCPAEGSARPGRGSRVGVRSPQHRRPARVRGSTVRPCRRCCRSRG